MDCTGRLLAYHSNQLHSSSADWHRPVFVIIYFVFGLFSSFLIRYRNHYSSLFAEQYDLIRRWKKPGEGWRDEAEKMLMMIWWKWNIRSNIFESGLFEAVRIKWKREEVFLFLLSIHRREFSLKLLYTENLRPRIFELKGTPVCWFIEAHRFVMFILCLWGQIHTFALELLQLVTTGPNAWIALVFEHHEESIVD